MDIKKHFQDLVSNKEYSFNEFLKVFNSVSKPKDKEDVIKYLFGPGRDSKYIPTLENAQELTIFFNILLTKETSPSLNLIQEKLDKQIKYVLPGIKSHTGRMINPSTKMSILKIEKSNENKFYYGDSFEQRRFSYAGNAAYQGERFFLESCFYYDNKLTGFLELIFNKDKVIENYSHYTEISDSLEEIANLIKQYESTEVLDELPQTFFPLDDGDYLSITVIPSFSMMNQIKTSLNNLKDRNFNSVINEENEHIYFYNKTKKIKIGGTQAQNVASFNSDNAGVYDLLDNTGPQIKLTKKLINEKVFYSSSLIKYNSPKLKINPNFESFNSQKQSAHIRVLVELFLKEKLENLFNVINFIEDYKDLLEKGNINKIEKDYISSQSKTSETFDYFYNTLIGKFYKIFENEKSKTNDFALKSKSIFKEVLGEML